MNKRERMIGISEVILVWKETFRGPPSRWFVAEAPQGIPSEKLGFVERSKSGDALRLTVKGRILIRSLEEAIRKGRNV